jgi:hypothetical protein
LTSPACGDRNENEVSVPEPPPAEVLDEPNIQGPDTMEEAVKKQQYEKEIMERDKNRKDF